MCWQLLGSGFSSFFVNDNCDSLCASCLKTRSMPGNGLEVPPKTSPNNAFNLRPRCLLAAAQHKQEVAKCTESTKKNKAARSRTKALKDKRWR
jgi:hypothetical protein